MRGGRHKRTRFRSQRMLNSLLPAAAPMVPSEGRDTLRNAAATSLSRDREVLDLVEQGEEGLIREAASRAYKLKQHYNTRGRIELGARRLLGARRRPFAHRDKCCHRD